jgi:hypothetical protein
MLSLDVARCLQDEKSTYHDSLGDKREGDPIKLVRHTLEDEPE